MALNPSNSSNLEQLALKGLMACQGCGWLCAAVGKPRQESQARGADAGQDQVTHRR